jgi:hypothetical protein
MELVIIGMFLLLVVMAASVPSQSTPPAPMWWPTPTPRSNGSGRQLLAVLVLVALLLIALSGREGVNASSEARRGANERLGPMQTISIDRMG